MSSNNITFDPDSGVPYGANLSIYTGGDFKAKFNVLNTASSAFNLTGYSGSAQIRKSTSIGSTTIAAGTFTVGITSALGGVMEVSMGSTDTRNLAEGRYMYDVLVSSGATYYNIVNGNVYVYQGISSAP
jgi:hypothetical protein